MGPPKQHSVQSFSSTTQSTPNGKSGGGDSGTDGNNNNNNDDNDDDDEEERRRRYGRTSGNWYIGIGWTLLTLVVIDQILQYKHEEETKERKILLAKMQYEADSENVPHFDVNLPTLFECTVRYVEHSLDGTMMLMSRSSSGPGIPLKVGEVVEVLDANVGPNGSYHLCRLRRSSSSSGQNNRKVPPPPPIIGWYPVEFLERV